MAKHTLGPWHVDPEYRTDRAGHMDGADQVCQANGNTVAFIATGMSDEQHHANANLIAAAPELLAEFKDQLRWLDKGSERYTRVVALIAKAEGKQ